MSSPVPRRVVLAGLGSAFATGCAPRPEEARRRDGLAVFDAVWNLLRTQHFDPPAAEDWRRVRRRRRPAAAQARDWVELYFDVLFPLLEPFDQSHVILRPPPAAVLPAGRAARLPRPRRGDRLLFLDDAAVAGLGADILWDGEGWQGFPTRCEATGPGAALVGRRILVQGLQGPRQGDPVRRYHLEAVVAGRPATLDWVAQPPPPATGERRTDSGPVLLRFDAFAPPQIDWLLARLTALDGAPALLDLRGNRGGDARQLHRLASRLLPPGAPVGQLVRHGRSELWRSDAAGAPLSSPVALLVGPRTASSAEVLTVALRHARRTPVVGRRTAGAVLFAMTWALPDGGALTLPIRDFRDPAGARIEGAGVIPDRDIASPCAQTEAAARLLVA